MSQQTSYPGTVHIYAPKLTAFEYKSDSHPAPPNLLIWIGGLFDGLLTTLYPTAIVPALPPTWSLAQVLLSSSYTGWGSSSIAKDVAELSQCITYFRSIKPAGAKIVIMGHSTGSQDVLAYLTLPPDATTSPSRPPVNAAIIQAPVSDREALTTLLSPAQLAHSIAVARELVAADRGEEMMPADATQGVFGPACSARRWLSLASPDHDGEDDYFSSDLTDEQLARTFGSVPPASPLCVLYSGSDQFVPAFVDKKALVARWIAAAKAGSGSVDEEFSAVVPGATHAYDEAPPESLQELVTRVVGFLDKI